MVSLLVCGRCGTRDEAWNRELAASVQSGLASSDWASRVRPISLNLVLQEAPPRITKEDVSEVHTLLASFTTSFGLRDRNRVHNIGVAGRSMAAASWSICFTPFPASWHMVIDSGLFHVFSDEDRRAQLKEGTNIFRVLIKTLLHAGIITQRTAPLYAVWVDMDELKAEGEGIPGDVVAEEMLVTLREINAKRRRIGAKDVTAAAS
jgi:hypothetical protein